MASRLRSPPHKLPFNLAPSSHLKWIKVDQMEEGSELRESRWTFPSIITSPDLTDEATSDEEEE